MCKSPNRLPDGTETACRECSLCQERYRNDWIGRNIAESKTRKFCYVITATYGRGKVGESLHERAVMLTYSDCRNLLKLLRRHGYSVRFFITGEYGSERGRAHWNVILYSDEPLPQFAGWDQFGRWTPKARWKQRFNWVRVDDNGDPVYLKKTGEPAYWWPHGFVYIEPVSVGNIRYVCKYVLKDVNHEGKQGYKGQSKLPPLGTDWFLEQAEKYVEQGLAPQSPEYKFPEAKRKNGELVPYWLKGRMLEMFIQHYIDTWEKVRGDQPRPPSEMVDLFEQYGRVIRNEEKVLELRDNPTGRVYQPAPTNEQLRAEKVQAVEKKAQKAREWKDLHWSRWAWQYVKGATDGEERQRRQEWVDQQERERHDEWVAASYARQHAKGLHQYCIDNKYQWAESAGRAEPCSCCDPLTVTFISGSGPLDGQRDEPRRCEPAVQPDDWFGGSWWNDEPGQIRADASGAGPGSEAESRLRPESVSAD